MYLKEFELRNFRKFRYTLERRDNSVFFSNPNEQKDLNVASRTSLLIGPNNCGKTTVITCLDKLLSSQSPNFTPFDFNLDYIEDLFNSYPKEENSNFDNIDLPEMEFIFKIEIDDTDDLINNIAPFLKISNLEDKIVEIHVKWEIREKEEFISKLKEINKNYKKFCENNPSDQEICDNKIKYDRLQLLEAKNFQLNYYNSSSEFIEKFNINKLIAIKLIKANKINSENTLSAALKKIIKFRYLNDEQNQENHLKFNGKLFTIASTISKELDKIYTEDINNTFNNVISSHNIGMNIDLNLDNLIEQLSKCKYLENGKLIPEDQYGLGYTNLIIIISEIISYVDNYHNDNRNSQIHLIAIEEPETYMHPQMQELFIKYINDAINELLKNKQKNLNSQLIITTHSPHILNSKIHSGCSLNNINYIQCYNNQSKIINLNDNIIINSDSNNSENELNFIKKHIKFKISELFFAEASIFVEGITEYNLLQYYIDQDEDLSRKKISIVLINGAHAKVYKSLINLLGIPVVIITDLDIKRSNEEEGEEKSSTYEQIENINDKKTTNQTLIEFYKTSDLKEIVNKKYYYDKNLMVSSQTEAINGFYATSFEEALILTNFDNKIINEILKKIKPNIYKNCSNNDKIDINKSFKLQEKLAKDKSLFANNLLFEILTSKEIIPKLPKYIQDAFNFIKNSLKG